MFHIIIKETKEFLRDKTNLFFFLMFPVSLVFLLGNLLMSMDHAEEAVGKIEMQYIINTENPYTVMSIEHFINTMEDNQNIKFDKAMDIDTSRKLAGSDEITAVVEFTGEPLTINIYEGTNRVQNRTVYAIMNGFIQNSKSISTVIKTIPEAPMNIGGAQDGYVQQKDLGVNRTMIDYYAVTMITMISFMSMIVGAGVFVGERQVKTINRLIIAPKNRISLFLQKILGLVPQVVIQLSVIMLVSIFVFKAHYAATLQNNLYLFLMFFVVTITMISIGAVIGLVMKGNPIVVIMPILWIMMFFGGTYSKEVNIQGFTNYMPSYQMQQAAFDLAIFGRFGKVNNLMIACFIIMAIALATGSFIFSRKEEER